MRETSDAPQWCNPVLRESKRNHGLGRSSSLLELVEGGRGTKETKRWEQGKGQVCCRRRCSDTADTDSVVYGGCRQEPIIVVAIGRCA